MGMSRVTGEYQSQNKTDNWKLNNIISPQRWITQGIYLVKIGDAASTLVVTTVIHVPLEWFNCPVFILYKCLNLIKLSKWSVNLSVNIYVTARPEK